MEDSKQNQETESNQNKPNKLTNFIKTNIFTILLIILLIYMRFSGTYAIEKETPIYVETCNSIVTGYAEKPDGQGGIMEVQIATEKIPIYQKEVHEMYNPNNITK